MKIGIKTIVTAGLLAGGLGIGATAAAAMPALTGSVAQQTQATPNVENVYCGYYGCRRYYRYGYYRPRYYRPYYRPYGYYRPYYGPRVGIGIGGVGLGFY